MAKKNSSKRITIRQVAEEAKLSPATVSMALKGDNRIRARTQKHVQKIAKKLGYHPDPALSALAAYRSDKKPSKTYGIIGFINTIEDFLPLRNQRLWFDDYLTGLKNQCQHYGYDFEVFPVSLNNRTKQKQLSRILYNKGVNGLVVGPFKDKTTSIDLDWSKFSVVATSVTNENSGIPYASNDYFDNLAVVSENLLKLGYQRIAFVQASNVEKRLGYRWVAAYLRETYRWEKDAKRFLPPYLMDPINNHDDPTEFAQWLEQNKPDVIITSYQLLFAYWLKILNKRVPQDIGLVGLQIESNQKGFSGIAQNTEYCGQLIINLLHSKLLRREMGLPEINYNINVQSKWIPGSMIQAQE